MNLPPSRERILLMGSPGTGKTEQLLNIAKYLADIGKQIEILDFEDKIGAYLKSSGDIPKNLSLQVALNWTEAQDALEKIEARLKPDNWIGVDRIDLAWNYVQRWYTQLKYQETLAQKMLDTSISMGKKKSMFAPRFDQGSWQVINEAYEEFINGILYRTRCNIVLTSGIKGIDENSPLDLFGNLGVLPRGQKELGHQPHSVFLLSQKKSNNKEITWHITTAKDLPNRIKFEGDQLYDFTLQYLEKYYK